MVFQGVVELRCRPQLAISDITSVTGDVDIVTLTGDIENSNITILTIQATMDVAVNYYVVDKNDSKHYLTNPSSLGPANLWFLATYLIPKGDEVSLRFSNSGNLTGLVVGSGAGVY